MCGSNNEAKAVIHYRETEVHCSQWFSPACTKINYTVFQLTFQNGGGIRGYSYCRKHCGLYSCFVEPEATSCPVTAIAPPFL